MFSFNRKIFTVFLLTLIAGITLSILTYMRGQAVIQAGAALTQESLPRFDAIAHLQRSVFSQKPLLYEYYATLDRQGYATHFLAAQDESVRLLRDLGAMYQASPEMARIAQAVHQIKRLGQQLDGIMRIQPIYWDGARTVLAEVSAQEARISPEIEALVRINRQQVTSYSEATHRNTLAMIELVAGFTIASLILTLFSAYFVRVHLRESADRKMLAIFPERSPNPMLRLAEDGAVIYANQSSLKLAEQLGFEHVAEILPLDLPARLLRMKHSGVSREQYEYAVGNRILDCTAHHLPDLHVCHVYLADISERKEAERRLLRQAQVDEITELPNRHQFRARLDNTLATHARCAIALIRPDRIRLMLESQGYAASDSLIGAMAERLIMALQKADASGMKLELFRFEGVTFGLLVTQFADTHAFEPLLQQLHTATLEPLKVEEREFFFTLSIGLAISPEHGTDSETLFKNAEAAVNRTRSDGGNGSRFYTQDLSQHADQWLALEHGLRRALERDEFILHYQPQINLSSGKIVGLEALIRWNSPERGMIAPLQFIPQAEASGLIIPIGTWVLRTACRQLKSWLDQGHDFVMAVNISARQFQQPGFVAQVAQILHETALPAQHLELEITESVALHDIERTVATLHELRQTGILLSIDDFGTGFSSLAYLQRFPLNKLKIDQSFVHSLSVNPHDASIAHTIILLGHSLKLSVIAEGVETPEQTEILRRLGCDDIQGDCFSRPRLAAEITETLNQNRRLLESPHVSA